jgi:hypothetical protein
MRDCSTRWSSAARAAAAATFPPAPGQAGGLAQAGVVGRVVAVRQGPGHRPELAGSDPGAAGEEAAQPQVPGPVEQHGVGRLAVAAGPAQLLVVGVEGVGGVGVEHEADVGLVDPHAEGGGGDDHRPGAGHERLLGRSPVEAPDHHHRVAQPQPLG